MNNDARLVSRRRARVVLAVRIGTQPLSARAQAGQPGGVACRGCPPGCMLGDDARGSASVWPPTQVGALLWRHMHIYKPEGTT